MDFTPTEEQRTLRDLAAEILDDLEGPELWKALAAAGVLGGMAETGLLATVLVLEEAGRRTAGIPLAATYAYGIGPIAAHGSSEQRERLLPGLSDGSAVATGAFPQRGGVTADGRGRLTGTVPLVPWLREAAYVLVPTADRRCWLVRVEDAGVEPVETTAPWAAGRLTLDATRAEPLGGEVTYADVLGRARTAFAGLQAGVCAGSLARAVEHTAAREQFGRPLATLQAVQLRAADAHMDIEAIRVTTYEAAWRYDEGLPAESHALTAAWWASEAGTRAVHAGQHLHGGIGADVEHPVHRHFLWGRQLDAYLGSAPELLAELGQFLAQEERTAEVGA
ncbi:acyl-CoA dehydrogenase family protein [Streptomyces pathocidini]|uniref:acyl-CoA dehydrogenase family protein n=1 Tax=Streptomyces pathocidini TaxID=1650571 RepID=UPI0033D37519